ncbi:MAG: sugar transferase, partial [Actinomycetota bacterium]
FGATREPELVGVLRACSCLPVEVHVVPRFFELGAWPEGPWVDNVGKIPLLGVRRGAWRGPARRAKRSFDLAAALVGLVVAAPVMAACALAVLVSSGRPILFRQKRVGEGGRVFELLKFRTFPVDNESTTDWSTPEEQCNRVQRLLRHTSLDELPQLVNVLRRDMSLVGPRPERPQWVAKFEAEVPRYEDRHRVPGGITGWAQIHGLRGDTSMTDRARFDNFYIENWSPWRDLAIVFRTPMALKGSRR